MATECPVCSTPVDTTSRRPWHPFCSERCKLVDLDRWLTGQYRIPGPPVERDDRDEGEPEDSAIRSEEEA